MPFDGLVKEEVPQESTIVKEEIRILITMKQLLLEKGWCQHAARDSKGQFCVIGAFHHTVRDSKNVRPLQIFIEANNISTPIPVWNDQPWLKFEEVLQALDKAIEYSKEHTI